MLEVEVPEVDYTRYTNRQLAAIPLAVLAVALAVLVAWYVAFGVPVRPGLAFTGGTELTVITETPRSEIPDAFDAEVASVQTVAGSDKYIVTFQGTAGEQLRQQAENNLQPAQGRSSIVVAFQQVSPSFGSNTQRTALVGVAVAFLGMSVVAFGLFRSFVPSIAIVLSAFSDLVIPLAVMNLVGIKLSLGTVAALLMLIGYSVDSDILLTNYVLRRSGDFYESGYRAMRTGVTMTVTSLSAMAVMAATATLFGIELLASIGIVLVFGLTADLMNTYMLNYSLLRWYEIGGVEA